jgi:hypothetical protein
MPFDDDDARPLTAQKRRFLAVRANGSSGWLHAVSSRKSRRLVGQRTAPRAIASECRLSLTIELVAASTKDSLPGQGVVRSEIPDRQEGVESGRYSASLAAVRRHPPCWGCSTIVQSTRRYVVWCYSLPHCVSMESNGTRDRPLATDLSFKQGSDHDSQETAVPAGMRQACPFAKSIPRTALSSSLTRRGVVARSVAALTVSPFVFPSLN